MVITWVFSVIFKFLPTVLDYFRHEK